MALALNIAGSSPPAPTPGAPPAAVDLSAVLPSGDRARMDGVYVHIPFCFHKCHYCDFYSITRQTPERMAGFVSRLLDEARQWESARAGWAAGTRTVFFGGGTPSLLPISEMRRLIVGLRKTLGLSAVDEWTIECNPATVDAAYLGALREAGVDRLSFGAQSFNPADLKALERHHDPDDVPRSLDAARGAGFERVSIDLIFGVPGQTLADWESSLRQGIALGTRHLSAYLLTYEDNTPMAVKKQLGTVTPAEESLELAMLARTREMLRVAGLPPYEISNYAVPGQECRHNLMYWNGGNYLGLGPSAASHLEGWRWRNRPHLGEWETAVDRHTPGATAIEVEQLPAERRQAELAYLMIRLAKGIGWEEYRTLTGTDARTRFAGAIEKLRHANVVEIDERGVRLIERGVALSDGVAAEFLAE